MKKLIAILASLIMVLGIGGTSFALMIPDSAQFAQFTQQVDNVCMSVINKFADLKVKHALEGEYRTDEQIYMEIATGKDQSETTTISNEIQNISPDVAQTSLGMTLPSVRNSNKAWYITKDGRVFNANGYIYNNKTYFSASIYTTGKLDAKDDPQLERANKIWEEIKSDSDSDSYYMGSGYIESLASNVIEVQNNGEYIDFKDSEGNVVNPQIINNRTMVPFRKIFNALGVADENISWDGETKIVTAKKDDLTIELQINNVTAKKTISGETKEITLDSAPVIIEGRTLVPVRFIAESMDKKVGWDAESKTVIIVDTKEIINDIVNSIPKYMELLNTESQSSKTYAMKSSIKGKVEYTSKEDKSYNSTVNLSGTVNTNVTENAIALDLTLKLTGKGELYNTIKENQLTSITLNIIISDEKVYLKNSALQEMTKGKWLAYENDSLKDTFALMKEETISFEKLLDVDEELLTVDTYQSLKMVSTVLKALLKDENIQITEKGSTKTYTMTMKLSDIKNILKEMDEVEELDNYDASVKTTTTLKNNVVQTSGNEVKFEYKEGMESVNVSLNIDGKVAKSNSISIPSESQIMDTDEIS